MLMGVLFDVLTGCCDIGVHASTRRPEGQHAGRPAPPGDQPRRETSPAGRPCYNLASRFWALVVEAEPKTKLIILEYYYAWCVGQN